MAWDNGKFYDILRETCGQFRKGEVYQGSPGMVEWAKSGMDRSAPGGVLEIYDMPPTDAIPDECETVDMHFVNVAVNKAKAEARRAELIALLDAYPNPEELAGGPSYMAVGGVVGDQGAAFELFALGKVLGIWDVITPEKMGFTGDMADQMAGGGFIMCTGYRRQAEATHA